MDKLPDELRAVEHATHTRRQAERATRTAIDDQRAAIRNALNHGHSTTTIATVADLSRQRVNLCRG